MYIHKSAINKLHLSINREPLPYVSAIICSCSQGGPVRGYANTHTALAQHLQPTKPCDNSVYAL